MIHAKRVGINDSQGKQPQGTASRGYREISIEQWEWWRDPPRELQERNARLVKHKGYRLPLGAKKTQVYLAEDTIHKWSPSLEALGRMLKVGIRKALEFSKSLSVIRNHNDLEFLIWGGVKNSFFCGSLGRVYSCIGGCTCYKDYPYSEKGMPWRSFGRRRRGEHCNSWPLSCHLQGHHAIILTRLGSDTSTKKNEVIWDWW